ncbi:MAG: hypothetical protein WAV28_06810 [Sedimentisphaerales bacterium]
MKLHILLFVLFGTSCALGADKYVSPYAADDSGTGTAANPYKKISTAISNVGDGNIVYLMAGTYDETSQGQGWYIYITGTAKSYTVKPYRGADINLITDGNWVCIRINADDSPDKKKTVVFENITFSFSDCRKFIYYHPDKELNLTFTDCVFDTLKDKPLIASEAVSTASTREIRFTRCIYHNTSNLYPMVFNDFALVYFDDCTLINDVSSGDCIFFDLWNECSSFVLKNTTIYSKTNGFYPKRAFKIGKLIIQNSMFVHSQTACLSPEYAIRIPDADIDAIRITGNTIHYTKTDEGIFRGICLGTVESSLTNVFRAPVIADNTIINDRVGYYGTGIYLGSNVCGASCFGNQITGFQGGINNYAQYSFITDNTIRCTDGINMWGGGYANIRHNSIASADGLANGRAIMFGRMHFADSTVKTIFTTTTVTDTDENAWGGNQSDVSTGMLALAGGSDPTHWAVVELVDGNTIIVNGWTTAELTALAETPPDGTPVHIVRFSEHNTVLNNIFNSSQAHYTITFDFNPRCGEDYIDYNCYQKGLRAFSNLGEAGQDNLSDFQMKWSSWSKIFPNNDAHSIEADPQFVDIANGDFRLKLTSPCLNAGKPTPNGGYTDIGAWQE